MAADRPHYEEAIGALFANEPARFKQLIAAWPADVRDFAMALQKLRSAANRRPVPVDPAGMKR